MSRCNARNPFSSVRPLRREEDSAIAKGPYDAFTINRSLHAARLERRGAPRVGVERRGVVRVHKHLPHASIAIGARAPAGRRSQLYVHALRAQLPPEAEAMKHAQLHVAHRRRAVERGDNIDVEPHA